MVVFTPVTPVPSSSLDATPVTPYEVLDRRMDAMTTQLDEIMSHFRRMAAATTPTPGLPPEPADDDSTAYGSTIHTITSPRTNLHPILEPTPPVQGPPPPVAASNAELIGDVRLSYTPQGQRYCRTTVSAAIQLSTFSTPEESMQLHSAQRREEMFVSRYYWGPPDLPTDAHCVAWLDMSLDGPYAGKQDRIAKLSFTLGDDTLASFMKFYTTLRAGLNSCGFNPHLLPILPRIRTDVDLTITPIVEESCPTIGMGNDQRNLRTPHLDYWQRAHDSLGMTLYALLMDSIKSSAPYAYQAMNNELKLGASNGFNVLHELIRMHHPRMNNSLAPSYSSIFSNPPVMAPPGREGSYELSHSTYIALYSDWETQLRYYPEFLYFKPTQLILRFVQGLLRELRPHIMHIENYLHRHQAKHKFKEVEPLLPEAYDATELHEVLTAAVRSLDLAGHTPTRIPTTPAIHAGVATIDLSVAQDNDFVFAEEYLADFASFCDDDLATTDPSFDICISAIQRFQNSRYQRGGPGGRGGANNRGGRPSGTPTACLFAPCSRTHPPEQCCICRAVHPVHRCWHVLGLPEGIQASCNSFKQLHKANEGPWIPYVKPPPSVSAAIVPVTPTRVTFQASQADPSQSTVQTALEDAVETVRADALQPYRSPHIRHLLTSRGAHVSAIDLPSFLGPDGTLISLPTDGPPLPDHFIAHIDDSPIDAATKTAYFHVDTGATCVVTDHAAELHCPISTQATCGTAAKGPRTTINAMGWLVMDFHTDQGTAIPLEFPQATEIQQFQRRSLSCHALQDLGYEVQHALLATGNLLKLRKTGTTHWHHVPLVTHGRSDYVKVTLHLPSVAGVTTFDKDKALTEQTVARIDLLTKLKGHSIIFLIHLRYGCAPKTLFQAILKFLNIDLPVPKDFVCPLCMSEKTVSLSRGNLQVLTFLPIGARIQMDFGFYKIPSIRGFTCFLVIVESRTSHRWAYCRRSKHPPIELCLWFIRMIRRLLGFSIAVVRTDGGGELWGSNDFRRRLFEEAQVLVEPTGGENSAANGKAERAIGMLGTQTQLLLCGAGLDPIFWCFALCHAATLSNIKPRTNGRSCPHIELFNSPPKVTSLRIFGSPIYRVDRRLTRRRPESATKKGIWLGLHGTADICVYMDINTKQFGYAHHYVVDELDLNKLPGDRTPAVRLLAGQPLPPDTLRIFTNN
jgi:hypothetical protein